jgi:hypothetical protein
MPAKCRAKGCEIFQVEHVQLRGKFCGRWHMSAELPSGTDKSRRVRSQPSMFPAVARGQRQSPDASTCCGSVLHSHQYSHQILGQATTRNSRGGGVSLTSEGWLSRRNIDHLSLFDDMAMFQIRFPSGSALCYPSVF